MPRRADYPLVPGSPLRLARVGAGESLSVVAAACGVTSTSLRYQERGITALSPAVTDVVARRYGLDPQALHAAMDRWACRHGRRRPGRDATGEPTEETGT